MSKLYQDAILDAKALRASAMANAKAALEEAFEPKIQEMLRLKLSEELDEVEDLEEEKAEVEENIEEMNDAMVKPEMEENLDINEAELEEILAQLEELSNVDEAGYNKPEMEEAKHDEMKDENLNEAEEEEEETEEEVEDEEGEVEGEEVGDETKIIDITLGDLKQVLQSVMAGSQDMGMDIPSDEADADSEAEAEISLDEILAELEAEGAEDVQSTGYAAGDQIPESGLEEKKKHDAEKDKVEEELEEAKSTIEKMRQDLQEVNLLNAKYLYMNKLFKSKTLTESQKVKVINALDRASSVTEVKNTYETLKESFEAKKQLKESIGFASQAAGMAPKQPIIEQDNMMSRWQKLAGIK
jgi:DNA repair exonuclease SbcCD ATPase subunit